MRHKQSALSPASLACLVLIGAALCQPALAQTARSGGSSGQSAQLVQQLQQLASERTSLQAENAKMKKELDDLRKERDTLKKAQQAVDERAQSSVKAALAQSANQRAESEQELKKSQDRMQELIAKFRETAQTLKDVETERTATKQTLVTRDQELKTCVDHNLALYQLNGEVLTHLENQSVWSRVAAAEPFTKLKRVQLENLVDDYKSRADDHRLEIPTAAASGQDGAAQPRTRSE